MDPRLLLQLSAKNNQRKTYLNKMKEDYSRPSLGNIYPSVTFEPLNVPLTSCKISEKNMTFLLGHFEKLSKQSILGHFGPFF